MACIFIRAPAQHDMMRARIHGARVITTAVPPSGGDWNRHDGAARESERAPPAALLRIWFGGRHSVSAESRFCRSKSWLHWCMMRGAHLSRPAPLPRREGAVLPHRKGQNTNCATQAAHGQACMRARTSEALAQGQGCWFSISLIVRDAPPRSFSLSSSARRQGASTSASLALRRFDSRGHGIFLATRRPRGREGRGGERHRDTQRRRHRQTDRQ